VSAKNDDNIVIFSNMPTKNIDSYIKDFPDNTQKVLRKIRRTIKEAAPKATEVISYGIPAFKLNDKMLVFFAGWKNHVSVYPIPPGPATFQKSLTPYIAGRGTLKFSLTKPIPYDLIKKVVKYHIQRLK
jgi:uncharacterized protein YdhG (YjbR/CyaY superfamily)